MTRPSFDNSLFIGKTILKIDSRAVNCVVFYFTDGTKVDIETDYFGTNLYADKGFYVTHHSNGECNWDDQWPLATLFRYVLTHGFKKLRKQTRM